MISDYRSTLRNRPGSLPEQIAAPDVQVSPEDDAVFLASWRDELLQRTWQALAAAHPAQYEVLLRRVENPDQTMAEIASTLTVPGGSKEQTAASVRVVLHRARARFAQLLMAEVQASMPEASPQAITDELRSLGLLPYVQAAPGA